MFDRLVHCAFQRKGIFQGASPYCVSERKTDLFNCDLIKAGTFEIQMLWMLNWNTIQETLSRLGVQGVIQKRLANYTKTISDMTQ